VQISQAFGGKLKGIERFESGNWALARRVPYLVNAQASFFCKTQSVTHFGTHGIFIGHVEDVRFAEAAAPRVSMWRPADSRMHENVDFRARFRVARHQPARPVSSARFANQISETGFPT
jgi:flavin reductase (DIM6/NTAB) family NADH-FMN oxidoreductase RutF